MIETIFIIFLVCFIFIFKYLYYNEVCYVEAFDSQTYLVRNLPDKDNAAQMLGDLRNKLLNFVDVLVENIEQEAMSIPKDDNKDSKEDEDLKEYYKYVKMIQKKLPNSIIKESSANSEYTSYSINKGEELVFCLRSKIDNKLHNINEIMYVAIHEIAHIGCPEIGHTPLFKKINKFLLEQAVKKNLYIYSDYKRNNKEYCGINLTSTILD